MNARINPGRRRLGSWLAMLWLPMALLPGPAGAAQPGVLLVHSGLTVHKEMLTSLRTVVGDGRGRVRLREVTTADYVRDPAIHADLIVTVGVEAAEAVLHTSPSVPVYCVLIPQLTYAHLVNEFVQGNPAAGRVSALYLDQPFGLQMRAWRLALPQADRLAVVLGPDSRHVESGLRRQARAQGIELYVTTIESEKQLIGALYQVMGKADVLFAVPDPLVFNRHTVQNVLLTTYRLGKPVIGFSPGYVHAGALLAVYSTPEQIGRELGEILLSLPNSLALPAPDYPKDFQVETNARVARSLGLKIAPGDTLTQQLKQESKEGRKP